MNRGIDFVGDAGTVIDALRAAELDFVARYYRHPSPYYPALSGSEARLLTASGLSIVAQWEAACTSPCCFSRLAGIDDATSAYRQAKAVGQPPESAIYFSVNFDASGTDIVGCVNEYFRGVNDGFMVAGGGIPDYAIGVYGSGAVCNALLQGGLVEYTWLAAASQWAGSRLFLDWSIRQGAPLSALRFDQNSNTAMENFGAFRVPLAWTPVLAAQTVKAAAVS